ncbi:MAG: sel1 repeat family protein [Candidatus Rokuibacteriota bacterium]|nr:MAG: sel1 repeat family protein [Candidatus Rokubacteria bacterium]
MRALPQFALSLATILLCAGGTAGADLESAQHAYQATALQDATALAEQGQAEAQVVLGRMYLTGRGVPKDPDTALKWFKAAAVQGNADGAFLLGAMYFLPRSDIPEGLRWVRLAAEQGNQDAQLLLGQTCMEGLPGLPRDPVQGGMWLRLAAKDNLPFYAAQLAAAERVMSPEQRAQSKALAAAWQPQPGLRREAPPSP